MENFIDLDNVKSAYLVGIGGISMSAIALYLLERGVKVSGSDINKNCITSKLEKLGAKIFYFHSRKNVTVHDVAIYSSAIDESSKEILEIKRLKIPIFKRSEFLAKILNTFDYSIAVSGSHGKTTATDMIANVFKLARKHPCVFLGGEDVCFGNYLSGENIAIIEACEYKKNFLQFNCPFNVVLNIDNDHQDSYSSLTEQIKTFKSFISKGLALVNNDDKNSKLLISDKTITFGIKNKSNFMAKKIKMEKSGYSFYVYYHEKELGKICLNKKGKHNVYNALVAVAVGILHDIPFLVIKDALENFCGIKRRNECVGTYQTLRKNNLKFICDYAHHPNEIKSMLIEYKKQLCETIVVFQPHTFSRTKYLMNEFVTELKNLQTIIIYKTYPAREKYQKSGSAKQLYRNLKNENCNCFYVQNAKQLKKTLERQSNNKKQVLFLGAGDIYDIAKKL